VDPSGTRAPAEPFHVVLRTAIHDRGLTLDRLHRRLVELGAPVSVATLSNWQRGLSRPDSPRSAQAVGALESVLGLTAGTLSALVGARRARGPRRPSDHDTSLWAFDQVRAEIDAPADIPCDSIAIREELVLGPARGQWELRVQASIRARENHLDRWVYYYEVEEGALPEVRCGPLLRLGRVATDEQLRTIAAEFLLSRSLARGETYPIDIVLTCARDGVEPTLHGRWLTWGCGTLAITVRFTGRRRPLAAYQISQLDQTVPMSDVAELPVVAGTAAHLCLRDVEPGFHGIRWEPA
jgi:hypothetical protein